LTGHQVSFVEDTLT